MIDVTSDGAGKNGIALVGGQPIALAAIALVLMLLGAGSIALWRAVAGALIAATLVLWAHYGTAVFFEIIAAGVAMCF